MIDINGAKTYFSTRTMGNAWEEYSTEQRRTAIEQAKRDLSRALGRPMREDEPQYAYGDRTRDEYAVYEQALFSLLRDALPTGSGGGDVPAPVSEDAQVNAYSLAKGKGKWSEEALAWLGSTGRVQTVLG